MNLVPCISSRHFMCDKKFHVVLWPRLRMGCLKMEDRAMTDEVRAISYLCGVGTKTLSHFVYTA